MPPPSSRIQPLQRPLLVLLDHPIEERPLHLHSRTALPLKAFSKQLSVGVHSFRNVAVEVAHVLAEQRLVGKDQIGGEG